MTSAYKRPANAIAISAAALLAGVSATATAGDDKGGSSRAPLAIKKHASRKRGRGDDGGNHGHHH